MFSFNEIRRGALGAAITLLLALSDGCPTTTRFDFDEMQENAVLDTEWDALGFHFVTGPLFGDLPSGNLPTAITPPNVPAPAGKVLRIYPFRFGEDGINLLWCRLDYPATRVQVTAGNQLGTEVQVRLLVLDRNGRVREMEKTVPAGSAISTVLEATVEDGDPEIVAFAVHGRGGVILLDNLIIDDIR
jgi:hypothetical protein